MKHVPVMNARKHKDTFELCQNVLIVKLVRRRNHAVHQTQYGRQANRVFLVSLSVSLDP